MQTMALQGVIGEAAREAVSRLYLSNAHSGLRVHEGDPQFLSQFALDNGLVDVWTALLVGHNFYSSTKGPNTTRALQRRQSRTSPKFLAAWSRWERLRFKYIRSERKAGRVRYRRRYAEREAAIKASNRAHLRQNLAQIEAGQHWGWLKTFAQTYLLEPDKLNDLVDDAETPLRGAAELLPDARPVYSHNRRSGAPRAMGCCSIAPRGLCGSLQGRREPRRDGSADPGSREDGSSALPHPC